MGVESSQDDVIRAKRLKYHAVSAIAAVGVLAAIYCLYIISTVEPTLAFTCIGEGPSDCQVTEISAFGVACFVLALLLAAGTLVFLWTRWRRAPR